LQTALAKYSEVCGVATFAEVGGCEVGGCEIIGECEIDE
jgi:hypothetical protein